MSAPIAAVPRRVNLRPGRRIHACGERQHVELVTGVQRERSVERPLPLVVRFLPAKVYGNSTFPAGPVRPALCHPVHDLHSTRLGRVVSSHRIGIGTAGPKQIDRRNFGYALQKWSRSRWTRTVHDQRCAQTIQLNLFWQPLIPKQKRRLARKFALSASV